MFPMQWRCSSSTALCEVVISFQVLFPYQTTVGFKLHNYDMGLVILSDEYFATLSFFDQFLSEISANIMRVCVAFACRHS